MLLKLLSVQLFLDIPAHTCRLSYPAALWLVALKMSLAEVILAIRTWAVWNRNKVVCVILTITMLGNLVVQCFFTILSTVLMPHYFQDPMYPGFRGCNSGQLGFAGADLPYSYFALILVEAIVFILMIISAIRLYRQGYTSELSEMIHRDGIFSYVILLAMTIGNIVMLLLSLRLMDNINTLMLTPLEEVLYSVLTSRIVMNIRDAGSRPMNGVETELHMSSMVFASEGAAWPHPAMELEAIICSDTVVV